MSGASGATTKTSKLSWYWNRLRCMSPPEMLHRAGRKARSSLQRRGWLTVRHAPAPRLTPAEAWLQPPRGMETSALLASAEAILEGRFKILSLESVPGGVEPRWNRNPLTGHDVPLAFGKTINYRDQARVGDIKYLWVLNRQAHLVTLAQAYSLTEDARYLGGIESHLRSWLQQCPYLRGPNWTSALELAMRLINWSAVWQLIGGLESKLFDRSGGEDLRDLWLESIYRHAHFIQGHLSRHSSANNHLIGEASGLTVAAMTWPFWPELSSWGDRGRNELIHEIELQNCPDGVNREQSAFYQGFVLEFALVAALAARANGIEMPPPFWSRLESMLEFVAAIMDVAGNVPMIGDADNCSVLSLSTSARARPYHALLGIGAVLFDRPAFKAKAFELDDSARWLLGESAARKFLAIDASAESLPTRRDFPDGGYFVLGCDFETEHEVRLVADAGPLGYLALAAHGHADALAFTMSVAGREILIDPGTYAYQAKKEWRNYFRGTSGHNTLRVDGQDQSIIGGAFIWLRRANVEVESFEANEERARLVARHDGYTRLSDPLIHRRELVFDPRKRRVSVEDAVECAGTHDVELFWHFSEHCEVEIVGATVIARNGPASIELTPPRELDPPRLLRGCDSPIAGWVSREFDVKTATTTAVCSGRVTGTTRMATVISARID